MMLKLLRWFPSATFFAILIITALLGINQSQNSSISSIVLVFTASVYTAALIKHSSTAIAFSWFLLATNDLFVLAGRIDGLFLVSLAVAIILSASLAELSLKSLHSAIVLLTERQVRELEGIAGWIILASFLSGMTSVSVSAVVLFIARSLNLSDPIIGVLLFGSIIFGVALLALSEPLSSTSDTQSSSS